jgi:hypothetical protein
MAWLPSRSLEEQTPIWFPDRRAIYQAARLPFLKNKQLSCAIENFVSFYIRRLIFGAGLST